ncbi:hypothetical protein THAOC_20384 [Thalassiosira oceanica]|uniref:Uncharacterized protein n=1 Tax=Thalassiosira oceanica TaxID=159749 RepID=K0SEM7_THAOC|nr:hypothetical protein THAOC_20384 [Thalassiosira oceanica]|eukprot:EJK59401.1 hypothetical protein THAOC_20384 [Thalassiosira oceanica]
MEENEEDYSPAEKKDRKRLRDRASQARKQEDPDVCDKDYTQKRARQARKKRIQTFVIKRTLRNEPGKLRTTANIAFEETLRNEPGELRMANIAMLCMFKKTLTLLLPRSASRSAAEASVV